MLLDSNLIIYATRPEYEGLRDLIVQEVPSVSVVSEVETLGYPELSEQENRFLEEFFEVAKVLSRVGIRCPRSDSTSPAAQHVPRRCSHRRYWPQS